MAGWRLMISLRMFWSSLVNSSLRPQQLGRAGKIYQGKSAFIFSLMNYLEHSTVDILLIYIPT